MRNLFRRAVVAAMLLAPGAVQAVPVMPVSYSTQNGEAGAFTYFDDSYNGSGNTATALAALSGGLGDLTDGIIATDNWFNTPGAYVGWLSIDPTITFYFSGPVNIDSVTFYFDDSNGAGGVSPPTQVQISTPATATAGPVPDPDSGLPFAFTFSGLLETIDSGSFSVPGIGVNVSSLEIRVSSLVADPISPFINPPVRSPFWIMLSEVQFDDGRVVAAVPEPMTLSLLGAGLAGIAAMRRRRA